MKAISLEDGRIRQSELEKCNSREDILELWRRDVLSQNVSNPRLSLSSFKELIGVISEADQTENWLSAEEAERVAVFAFGLLDTDENKTLSFSEFEVTLSLI